MRIDYPLPEQLDGLRSLWKEAFGDTDAFLDIFRDTAFSPDRCRCVTVDGQVAAALYWFDCRFEGRPLAYIYAVATGKTFRKRGLCRLLMDDTRALLSQLGYSGILLVPEMHLIGMYESMGYAVCSYVQEFTCRRSDRPVAIRKIDAGEYAALRRQLLPSGGVRQEGENLRFLAAITDLYAGDGFLYADDAELLGDTNAAPGILAALGKDSGLFRCPGGDIPFAMYLALDDNAAPTYFGLAFD
ncbi:MAG: GNAT family N-acetyltransferase [Oscillospiraceae bacterium]|nr:GNAT family N-acetyltransferase [Oscillospiraceae bacterium]